MGKHSDNKAEKMHKFSRRAVIIAGIFVAIVVFLPFLPNWFTPYHSYSAGVFREEAKTTVTIANEEDFYDLINNTKIFNDVYELKKDLTLDRPLSKSIGSADRPFEGTFHGNGHTITFAEGVENTRPLFGYIGEEGIVTRLGYTAAYAVKNNNDRNATLCGGLALYNAGRIDNCLVDVSFETEGKVIVGGIAACNAGVHASGTNLGEGVVIEDDDVTPKDRGIYYCRVEASFHRLDSTESIFHMASVIGGAVAYNTGTIAYLACRTTYADFPETLPVPADASISGSTSHYSQSNHGIGAVIGSTGKGTIFDCVTVRPRVPAQDPAEGTHLILSDGALPADGLAFYEEKDYSDKFIFDKLEFSKRYWSESNCRLITPDRGGSDEA